MPPPLVTHHLARHGEMVPARTCPQWLPQAEVVAQRLGLAPRQLHAVVEEADGVIGHHRCRWSCVGRGASGPPRCVCVLLHAPPPQLHRERVATAPSAHQRSCSHSPGRCRYIFEDSCHIYPVRRCQAAPGGHSLSHHALAYSALAAVRLSLGPACTTRSAAMPSKTLTLQNADIGRVRLERARGPTQAGISTASRCCCCDALHQLPCDHASPRCRACAPAWRRELRR